MTTQGGAGASDTDPNPDTSGQGGDGGTGGGGQGGGGDQSQGAQGGDNKPAFALPDAYKEKGWAKNIKSQDDVYKMLDNAQTMAGKKTVALDFTKATPAEIEAHYNTTRPQDKSAYQFDDGVLEAERPIYADMLHKHGITAHQGNALIKDFRELENKKIEGMYNKDGFMAELKQSFGDGYEKVAGATAKMLASHLNEADRALLEKMPNNFLGLIYRAAGNMAKAYGASEGGHGGEGGESAMDGVDNSKLAADLMGQIQQLDGKPHTAEEKMALVNKYAAAVKGSKK